MSRACSRALRPITSIACRTRSGEGSAAPRICTHPRIAFKGVRSSCESTARNSSLARLAVSASTRARCARASSSSRSTAARRSAETSMKTAIAPLVSPPDLVTGQNADDVAYFVVDDKLVDVVTRDGRRFGADQTLGELELQLPPGAFFRINRQYLVRAEAITGFRPFVKGRLCVELSPPAKDDVVVSQENAGRFRAWLGG